MRARVNCKFLEILSDARLAWKLECAMFNRSLVEAKARNIRRVWSNAPYRFWYVSMAMRLVYNLKRNAALRDALRARAISCPKLVGYTHAQLLHFGQEPPRGAESPRHDSVFQRDTLAAA